MFKQLGVVGFTPSQLTSFIDTCHSTDSSVFPTVYQGEYNILTRGACNSIFPLLREHGIKYYAHCPLAAGFLTGKFTNWDVQGTRFASDHPLQKVFINRYDKPELHAAVRRLSAESERLGIEGGLTEVAIRWLYYHAGLQEGDGVVWGATKVVQIVENEHSRGKGSLPESMVNILDEVWEGLREERGGLL
jgi:aflatoxin B1 aldehyde reductase